MDEMLKRKPLMKRKGPSLAVVIGVGEPKKAPPVPVEAPEQDEAVTHDESLVKCPNCDCVFDAAEHPAPKGAKESAYAGEADEAGEPASTTEEQD